jgi:hypothetical protein
LQSFAQTASPTSTVSPTVPPTVSERALIRHATAWSLNHSDAAAWSRSLPTFFSEQALKQSPWYSYLQQVYGGSTSFTFPVRLSTFNIFYDDFLPLKWKQKMKVRQSLEDGFPMQYRELHRPLADWYDPSLVAQHRGGDGRTNVTWVYMYEHSICRFSSWPHINMSSGKKLADPSLVWPSLTAGGAPSALLPYKSHSLVEVMHTCCDDGNKNMTHEQTKTAGYWTYLAIGSGIYLDLGVTKVFADYMDAFEEIGQTTKDPNSNDFAGLVLEARRRGYDTLQFTHRCELSYRYEILDVRVDDAFMDGTPCRTGESAAAPFRSGWGGSKACLCRASQNNNMCLNCVHDEAPNPMSPGFPYCPLNLELEASQQKVSAQPLLSPAAKVKASIIHSTWGRRNTAAWRDCEDRAHDEKEGGEFGLCSLCVFSKEMRCAYILIPKAASTTVGQVFTRQSKANREYNCKALHSMRDFLRIKNLTTFTFLRNPLSRIVSAYNTITSRGLWFATNVTNGRELFGPEVPDNKTDSILWQKHGVKTILHWLLVIERYGWESEELAWDAHLIPQRYYIHKSTLEVDRYFCVEDIQSGFASLGMSHYLSPLSRGNAYEHSATMPAIKIDLKSAITGEILQRIGRLYKADLALWRTHCGG